VLGRSKFQLPRLYGASGRALGGIDMVEWRLSDVEVKHVEL